MIIQPIRQLPNDSLFYSPLGLFEFQAEGVAEAYLRTSPEGQSGVIAVYDTGLGKTVVGMGLAAYLFEDDQIDLVMVICEKNKLTDWRDEFERFTGLNVHRYHGTGRQKRLAKVKDLHVFATTYETGRNELMTRQKMPNRRSKGSRVDGPLVEALDLRNKRVLWIFDEITKLRSRSSELHHAYDYILHELRKGQHHQRLLGLTATPMERDFEDAYNVGRIVCPEKMPTVEVFEKTFTSGVDIYGHYTFRRDRIELFATLFQDITMRKRKTDPDVIDQFPQQIEKSIVVEMLPEHEGLYEIVQGFYDPPEGEEDLRTEEQRDSDERRLYGVLRMTAGHPACHLHTGNSISTLFREQMGEVLRSIRSSKTEELIARLKPLIRGQGAQAVIFTFYANTVLLELVRELREAGFSVAEYHGGRNLTQNDDAKEQFIRGNVELLVTSDAGSKGLNLGNAEYVFEYESALTYATRTQRINRVHRINSSHPLVTCYTMIVKNTIEEGIIQKVLQRNENQDTLLGDEDDGSNFVSAATRRELLQVSRKRR
jgi:SNF2 family DNA or RNA helicase